jgi:hypothetical protein
MDAENMFECPLKMSLNAVVHHHQIFEVLVDGSTINLGFYLKNNKTPPLEEAIRPSYLWWFNIYICIMSKNISI